MPYNSLVSSIYLLSLEDDLKTQLQQHRYCWQDEKAGWHNQRASAYYVLSDGLNNLRSTTTWAHCNPIFYTAYQLANHNDTSAIMTDLSMPETFLFKCIASFPNKVLPLSTIQLFPMLQIHTQCILVSVQIIFKPLPSLVLRTFFCFQLPVGTLLRNRLIHHSHNVSCPLYLVEDYYCFDVVTFRYFEDKFLELKTGI